MFTFYFQQRANIPNLGNIPTYILKKRKKTDILLRRMGKEK